jgi:uncharacterized protein (TIGR00266 family)
MHIEILYRPAHALARVELAPHEAVTAEAGALVGMTPNLRMETQSGGLLGGVKRFFGGESFFRNTFSAPAERGELLLAHALCGDMRVLDLTQAGFFLQSSAFVAATPNVSIETGLGGLRGFFSGAGLFVLRATAPSPGLLVLGAFGGIEELTCDGSLLIDTGHLVAWDATLQYSIGKSASGWLLSYLSGEGLVCHFRGQGRIWIQSRSPSAYGRKVGSLLPPRKG